MKRLRFLLFSCILLSLFLTAVSAKDAQKIMYDYIDRYSEGLAVAGIWSGEWDYGYIDSKAKVQIKPQFKDARAFVSGAASVGTYDSHKKIKYGFINKDGSFIIKPGFDETKDFQKIPNTKTEVAIVGLGDEKSTRKYGLVKKDGSYLATPQFNYIEGYSNQNYSCEFTVVYNKVDGKDFYGVLDSRGKLVVDTKYSFISISDLDVKNGFIVIDNNSLHGFYDIKNNKVIEPVFSSVLVLEEGVNIFNKIDGKELEGVYLNNGTMVEPKYDRLHYWNTEKVLYKTELNGKYGLLGRDGSEVLEPAYDEVRDLGDWQYAELNGKTRLITKDGKFINDTEFDTVGHLSMFNLLVVKVNGKTGLLDIESNKYLVEPLYDEIYYFEDGYAKVKLNGKEGIIDRKGKVILEPVYDYIYTKYYITKIKVKKPDGSYSYADDKSKPPVVKVKKDGKESYLSSDFTLAKGDKNSAVGDFDSIGDFEDGLARVTKGDKVGYVKEDLTYVVRAVWDSAFRTSRTVNGKEEYYDYFHIKKGEKWGIAFMDGSVIEPVSETMCSVGDNIAAALINGKWRYINKSNKFLNNEEYLYAYAFSEGVGLVQKETLQLYFIDTNGKRVSDIYKGASSYSEGLAYVYTDSGAKYIDHKGKVIIGDKLNLFYGYPFNGGIAIAGVSENGKALYGVIKKDGTWLVKPIFDKVGIKDGKYVLYQNGKEAEVTPEGKIIWK